VPVVRKSVCGRHGGAVRLDDGRKGLAATREMGLIPVVCKAAYWYKMLHFRGLSLSTTRGQEYAVATLWLPYSSRRIKWARNQLERCA